MWGLAPQRSNRFPEILDSSDLATLARPDDGSGQSTRVGKLAVLGEDADQLGKFHSGEPLGRALAFARLGPGTPDPDGYT